ncbi:putative lipid-transfer protein DIR1 [Prosopis cineraria]|uniref:putative lipid-transfer protein DIR1 n=1 Tax=Prosopis cineraria TaxID=364024 RepID=UPI00240EF756|nr:putative lipid-transfer protein DIR1 [Prosopis cineraria]
MQYRHNEAELVLSSSHRPAPAVANRGMLRGCRHADLACLCKYKSVLPALGIDPNKTIALPAKCGVTAPPQCKGN